MSVSLTVVQLVGLAVAGLTGGAALLTLFLSGISAASDPDSFEAKGCGFIGMFFLVGAFALSIGVLAAA